MTSIEYLLYSYDNYKMVLTKSMPSKLSTGKPCPRTWPCGTWPVCLGGSEDVMSYIGSPQTSYIEVLTPGSLCVTSLEQTAFAEVTKWGQWGELRSFWPHFIPSTRRKYGHRHVEGRRSKDTGRTIYKSVSEACPHSPQETPTLLTPTLELPASRPVRKCICCLRPQSEGLSDGSPSKLIRNYSPVMLRIRGGYFNWSNLCHIG